KELLAHEVVEAGSRWRRQRIGIAEARGKEGRLEGRQIADAGDAGDLFFVGAKDVRLPATNGRAGAADTPSELLGRNRPADAASGPGCVRNSLAERGQPGAGTIGKGGVRVSGHEAGSENT